MAEAATMTMLDIRDTLYPRHEILPEDDAVRAWLEAKGIVTGSVKVKANGMVIVWADGDPTEIWKSFGGKPVAQQAKYTAVFSLENLVKTRDLLRAGKATEAQRDRALADIITMALQANGIE